MDWALKQGLFWGYDKDLDQLHVEVPQEDNYTQEDVPGYQKTIIAKKSVDNGQIVGIIIGGVKDIKNIKVSANEANTRIIAIKLEKKDTNRIQIDF